MSLFENNNRIAGFSRSQREDIQDAFKLFDTKGIGKVSASQVLSVLKELQQERGQLHSQMKLIMTRLSSLSEQKMLNEEEFVELVTAPDPNDTRSEMEKVFDLFDSDRKGYIDLNDLRRVADGLGESMDDEELQEMINRATQNGKVALDDFSEIMNRKLFS